MNQDGLFVIFEKRLFCPLRPPESEEALIQSVVEEYAMTLLQDGHIPFSYLENLSEDFELEVRDMLKATTYGFVSLNEFLQSDSYKVRLEKMQR